MQIYGEYIYLKNRKQIAKFIIYKEDEKVYLIELPQKLYGGYKNCYVEISQNEYEDNCIEGMENIIKSVNKSIDIMTIEMETFAEQIKTLKLEYFIDEYTKDVKKEILALSKSMEIAGDDSRENQKKAMKQLEKALKRKEQKAKSQFYKSLYEMQTKEKRLYEDIVDLRGILAKFKATIGKKEKAPI